MYDISRKNDSITCLKAAATILVIVGHVLAQYKGSQVCTDTPCIFVDVLIRIVYVIHIPLFFTIAGYLNHSQPYGAYLKKKVKRIIVPFIVFSILKLVFSNYISSEFTHGDDILFQLKDAFLYGSLYWFCYAIFLVFAAAPLLWSKSGEGVSPAGIILAAVCGLASTFLPMFGVSIPHIFQLDSAVFYFPFFAAGYCLRQKGVQISSLRTASRLILISVSIFTIIAFLYLSDTNAAFETFFPVKFLAAYSCIFLICLIVSKLSPGKTASSVSGFSLQIMFFDSFFRVVLFYLASSLGLHGFWLCIPIAVTDIFLCLLSCRISERFSVTRIITGIL